MSIRPLKTQFGHVIAELELLSHLIVRSTVNHHICVLCCLRSYWDLSYLDTRRLQAERQHLLLLKRRQILPAPLKFWVF